MQQTSKVKAKYLQRLTELIEIAEKLPTDSRQRVTSANMLDGHRTYTTDHFLRFKEFVEWRTGAASILDSVVPHSSIHRKAVDSFPGLSNELSTREYGISFLTSIRHDFENGFLENLVAEIDSEITAEYLVQAEELLQFSRPSDRGELAAAVVVGAVLEHGLKGLCQTLSPPEAIEISGKRLTLSSLIDTLKKRRVFNELTAKQLRAWADIRNAAAHGNSDEFNRHQVESMVTGVTEFLTRYT